MEIIKNYKIPIYKVLATAGLEVSSPATSNSDLYLATEQELSVEYFNSRPTEIFSISSKNTSTIIHSNTLGILISDIKDEVTSEYFYFKIKLKQEHVDSPEVVNEIKELANSLFSSYLILDGYLYHNNEENLIEFLYEEKYPSTPVLDLSLHYSLQYSKIRSIRNLKNQFKITLNIPLESLEIKLKSDNVFGLNILSENSVSLNPFILDSKLFTKHSFYSLQKDEAFLTDLVTNFKLDSYCLSEEITYNSYEPFEYTILSYLTEYSNLQVILPSDKTYIYINTSTQSLEVAPLPLANLLEEFTLIAVVTKKTLLVDVVGNSYKANIKKDANFKKLFITSTPVSIDMIPVGACSFVYSLRDVIRNKQSVVETSDYTVYQLNQQQDWSSVNVRIPEAPLTPVLDNLKDEVTSYFANDPLSNTTNYNYEIIDK